MTDATYNTLTLSWTNPKYIEGVEDEAKGYYIEIRPAESPEWESCNANAVTGTSYTVKGLKSLAMYWVRVIASNDGGNGEPQELDNYILAMPPPGRNKHCFCFARYLHETLTVLQISSHDKYTCSVLIVIIIMIQDVLILIQVHNYGIQHIVAFNSKYVLFFMKHGTLVFTLSFSLRPFGHL